MVLKPDQKNSKYILVADAQRGYKIPGNMAYYMRPELKPELRFNPPQGFKDMLLGVSEILLGVQHTGWQRVGWTNYAHATPNGARVYSGIYGGIFSSMKTFDLPAAFADSLIESHNREHVSVAANCTGMSDAELRIMDTIYYRTKWLQAVSECRAHMSDDEINELLASRETEMKTAFGENNYLCRLSPRGIRFPV